MYVYVLIYIYVCVDVYRDRVQGLRFRVSNPCMALGSSQFRVPSVNLVKSESPPPLQENGIRSKIPVLELMRMTARFFVLLQNCITSPTANPRLQHTSRALVQP